MLSVASRWCLRASLLASIAIVGTQRGTLAQCTTDWLPDTIIGTNGAVLATTMWDPDGAGPANPVLVLGGSFSLAGSAVAANIVTWDPLTDVWSPLGAGTNGNVTALAAQSNGDLVVAGTFTTAGGVAANGMARWNGALWSALGNGVAAAAFVNAVVFLPNGDLIAGGGFTSIAGVVASRLARWDGASWSPMGTGANQIVYSLAVAPNGDLIVGGAFATVDGVAAAGIARWDGATWSAFGTGIPSPGFVRALGTLPNGDVYAAGSFTVAGGVSVAHTARWNGTSWSALGTWAAPIPVQGLAVLPNGEAYFWHHGPPRVWHWDGQFWWTIGASTANFSSLTTLPSGELVVCGHFERGFYVQGTGFVGRGWDGGVNASAVLPSGDVVVGGTFTKAAGVSAAGLARWDGTSWAPLIVGFQDSLVGQVLALSAMSDGRLLVGGAFHGYYASGPQNIGIWNGTSWSTLGFGTNGAVTAVASLPSGDIFVGGSFTTAGGVPVNGIARWNGTTWSAMGAGITGFQSSVRALLTMPNGDLIAGGFFSHAGGAPANCIARWDGTAWSTLGLGMIDAVNALTTTVDGDLVAAGEFNWAGTAPANRIARWNGSSWSPLGSGLAGFPAALTKLPNGDLIASLYSSRFNPQDGFLQRWDGVSWSSVVTGANAPIATMAMMPEGTLAAGGSFSAISGVPAAFFVEVGTSCPATAATFGAGCPGSGGENTLTATTLPWIGSTFRATGTGLPTVSIVLTLTSVTAVAQGALPLTVVFPQAGAGCDVLTLPDLLGVVITTNGTAQSELFLPNTSPLIGIPFYHQMVPIEVDTNGAWSSVVATNALQLVAGSF